MPDSAARCARKSARSSSACGLTVAYVTHNQGEALAVSERIIVMAGGEIAQAGTPDELYERPASEFVAGFMGEAMLFDASWRADGGIEFGSIVVRVAAATARGEGQIGEGRRAARGLAHRQARRRRAWRRGPEGRLLGSTREYTFQTALGPIFVVATADASRMLARGEKASLVLAGPGVAIVPAARR
jgi:iron(III) transport system ATP-binding protein